jgi:hypothetical protein
MIVERPVKVALIRHTETDLLYVYAKSPRDVFGHTLFTICGACIEKDLLIVRQSDEYFAMHPSERIVLDGDTLKAFGFNDFIHDELIGPVAIFRTDSNGELVDYV